MSIAAAQRVLEAQERLFARQAARVAGQGAVGAHHTVTGEHDGDGVGPVGRPDSP
ncbi:MAG: hypothetical protein ACYC1D_20020 [Acidimicrobiales bacterium]